MRNLNPMFDDYEFNRRQYPSYFRRALSNFAVLLSIIGTLALIFGTAYFGIGAGIKQMDIQNCKDFQSFEAKYPNSITQQQRTFCDIIGIEINK